jgi:hypothetical protein
MKVRYRSPHLSFLDTYTTTWSIGNRLLASVLEMCMYDIVRNEPIDPE